MFFTVLTALAFLPEPLFTYIVARFYIFGKHIFDFCIYFFLYLLYFQRSEIIHIKGMTQRQTAASKKEVY